MKTDRLVLALVLSATAAFSSGCALLLVGGAGAATYAYVNGESRKYYPYPVEQTWPAVRDSVVALGLPVVQEASNALGARLESRNAEGQKVTIKLEPKGAATKVEIRIGVFGDEDASQRILAEIDTRLAGGAAIPPPLPDVHVGVMMSR